MRFQSYFNTAIKIIELYNGEIPLQHFLKNYFSENKKHGSKDRKFITHICYNFYRLGKAFIECITEEKLKLAIFICNDNIIDWHFLFDENWIDNWSNTLPERIVFVQRKYSFSVGDIFPFKNDVSKEINADAFIKSFLIQPDVFIRTRPHKYDVAVNKLQEHAITFKAITEDCIQLSSSTKIDTIIALDEEAVVQDLSSQRIKEFLSVVKAENHQQKITVWDCCAGSGGKSILAYDVLQNIDLTVSDVRPSIIQNLKQRFAKAGIKNYKSLVLDIANSKPKTDYSKYNLIICDAPCSGSGTWSRTPEQLYFFQPEKIDHYALLQQKIISNAITSLKENGFFLYITCSVFDKENEQNALYIKQQFHLELIKMELLKGYNNKADTMFAALFQKTN